MDINAFQTDCIKIDLVKKHKKNSIFTFAAQKKTKPYKSVLETIHTFRNATLRCVRRNALQLFHFELTLSK